jgi:hypothetical protein
MTPIRACALACVAVLLLLPGIASAAHKIRCSELPEAERFVEHKLLPGPNTRAAKRHLARAKHAKSERQCAAELRKVDYYARRSFAADERLRHRHIHRVGHHHKHPHRHATHVACADWLHQNRPGGTDYHGPPVSGCRQLRG